MKATMIATASAGERHKIAAFTATATDRTCKSYTCSNSNRTGNIKATFRATASGQGG
jgi:hypothetical protein